MNQTTWNPFKARFFSAYAFFTRGLLLIAVFMLLELAGWREYTSFISGTTSGSIHDLYGFAYFIFYALALFLAPVLLIASAIFAAITRWAAAEP